jgi:hypothetical protein
MAPGAFMALAFMALGAIVHKPCPRTYSPEPLLQRPTWNLLQVPLFPKRKVASKPKAAHTHTLGSLSLQGQHMLASSVQPWGLPVFVFFLGCSPKKKDPQHWPPTFLKAPGNFENTKN